MEGVPIRVAYTLEQCWHPSPGGTAIAALRIAEALRNRTDVATLHQVAGKHAAVPPSVFRPTGSVAMLPLARPWLYETWTRLNWPKVESVIGQIDVAHATGLVPCGTSAPLVVTLHDLNFVHDPDKFSKHGVRLMNRSLDVIRSRADRVICPSQVTIDECVAAGLDESKLRLVPLGVDAATVTPSRVEQIRRRHGLPDEFVLFVGTIEPRKNLHRLAAAMRHVHTTLPLVVVGAPGWGEAEPVTNNDVRFLGFVDDIERDALYAAASVFAYPSEREGFGLPVAEAMAHGTAVVTSAGTSTEEVADGAAVLVDPFDVHAIAAGVAEALDRRAELAALGLERSRRLNWGSAADRTLEVYRELAPPVGGAGDR